MSDVSSIFAVPNYMNALLFAAIAIICAVPAWRQIKHQGTPLAESLGGRTTATVVNAKRSSTLAMGMSTPKNSLLVEYKVDGSKYSNFVNVSPSTMKHYAPLLKALDKAQREGKASAADSKEFDFTIYYDKKDPNVIACDDTIEQSESNGRLFVCLFFAFAIAAVVFAIMPVE